jgi:hypothetical protein
MAGAAGSLMARPKKSAARSPKNKERQEPGFTTKGIRMSNAYAEWLEQAAKHSRMTIATFLDRAAAAQAKADGFNTPPPERNP